MGISPFRFSVPRASAAPGLAPAWPGQFLESNNCRDNSTSNALPVWRDASTMRPTSCRYRRAALSLPFAGRRSSIERADGHREGTCISEFMPMQGGDSSMGSSISLFHARRAAELRASQIVLTIKEPVYILENSR